LKGLPVKKVWRVKINNDKKSVGDDWKGMVINVNLDDKSWLTDSWVGTLVDLKMNDRSRKIHVMDGSEEVNLRYMGGDLVLTTGGVR